MADGRKKSLLLLHCTDVRDSALLELATFEPVSCSSTVIYRLESLCISN
ncbi:hypothetical protein T10_3564 [Trichinella papuae]|uniref:Uncharacterized protein n=1 Tax=Trichinella papuae TaxID=268474 RepID=A0A0V1N573_9BILA|nr:hypothetical protein T10_3564 [Trichinella papuae]